MMTRVEEGPVESDPQESLSIDWKEALFLATRGGAC